METILIALGAGILYIIAYNTYGRWLGARIFNIDPNRATPAVVREDGNDFVPSNKFVVFGHHFTSIAGTGPIVGPAIAVIWGWLPALLWVVFGSIFIGAVHDFASLVMSLRNQGRTIGDYCGSIINTRVRILFLLIIMFALWIVIAIFGLVIAAVFKIYPVSVFPVWIQIPIAVAFGLWIYKRSGNLLIGGVVSLVLMYISIYVSAKIPAFQLVVAPEMIPALAGKSVLVLSWLSPVAFWTVLLLIYCFIASVIPVQTLLQPRDFINALQLVSAMGLLLVGLVVAHPAMVAPAIRTGANLQAPMLFPFLFITVACGACSGFHCLVSSGTSSKQLKSEGDARYVGYGSMLLEGMLAVLVIIACCAGLGMKGGSDMYLARYANWAAADSLGAKLGAFIDGSANMMEAIGISHAFAIGIMGVFVASFAATTLDSTTRLQRYVIGELGRTIKQDWIANKYVATTIAVASGFALAMFDVFGNPGGIAAGLKVGGTGAMKLWPLFGATNQLLAGLALLVATVWLFRRGKPIWITAAPMVFMLGMTGWGLTIQLREFMTGEKQSLLLLAIGSTIFILEIWMIAEACIYMAKLAERKREGRVLPELVVESA